MSSRGAKKAKIGDLSRRELTREEKDTAYETFLRGAPIVTAILGQGLVEYELDRLLRTRLKRRDDDTWDALTADRGPRLILREDRYGSCVRSIRRRDA